jgi:hypothetical protein
MNERIDELMIQSGARFEFLHGVHYDDFQYKTFAELIVRECIHVAYNKMTIQKLDGIRPSVVCDAIKEHFGVEE